MNQFDSYFEKIEIVLDTNEPVDLSNSNFNRLEEIKAISIPEKNAESKRVIITIENSIF
jgi:acetolactate synthase regulatory subunit